MRKLLLLASFFVITPFYLLASMFLLSYLQNLNAGPSTLSFLLGKHQAAYAALPTAENIFTEEMQPQDARAEIVRQFFEKYKSPLEPYAKHVIEAADTYDVDFRLIPAIAMQESNLCLKAPKDSNNCWGFGIYGMKVTRFPSYPEAIETVTRTLAREYKGKGLHTPEEIMRKYTPSSNGSWAYSVSHFMEVLQ